MSKSWCPLPEKIFEYDPDLKLFQSAYLQFDNVIFGSKLLTSLYLVTKKISNLYYTRDTGITPKHETSGGRGVSSHK